MTEEEKAAFEEGYYECRGVVIERLRSVLAAVEEGYLALHELLEALQREEGEDDARNLEELEGRRSRE